MEELAIGINRLCQEKAVAQGRLKSEKESRHPSQIQLDYWNNVIANLTQSIKELNDQI